MTTLSLPEVLHKFVAQQSSITLKATNTLEICEQIQQNFPQLYSVIYTDDNELSGFVNFFYADHLLASDEVFPQNAVIELLVSVSGG